MVILTFSLLFSCRKYTAPEVDNRATADFECSYDKKTPAPVQISFTNKSKNAYSYIWDFGDGDMSTTDQTTVFHIYSTSGYYTVILTAIGMPGDTSHKFYLVGIK